MSRKALFIDRDGTLNVNPTEGTFVSKWEDWKFLPNAEEALRRFIRDGYIIVIVTNQSGIGRGLYTESDVEKLHKRVGEVLKSAGVEIASFYYCPHIKEDNCECRKPKPGMILRAARELDIDLSKSIFAGDAGRDVEAGKAAGCKTAFIYGGAYLSQRVPGVTAHPDYVAQDLLKLHEAVSQGA